MYHHVHPALGNIVGAQVSNELVQFRSLPYASIPRRFARSSGLTQLPKKTIDIEASYDASEYGPSCIQPLDSIEKDVRWNQLPKAPQRQQSQDEDCLRLTLTVPNIALEDQAGLRLPVVIFIHGGALVIGSGERQYYDPIRFCSDALKFLRPVIFVSINYRLGALGFLHSPEAPDLLPPNNGLYDQLVAFEWIRSSIAGSGGDPEQTTATGQSAGAASVSLHSTRPQVRPFKHVLYLFAELSRLHQETSLTSYTVKKPNEL